jgi:AhpD family alkylhydroperoxidase
MTGSAHFKGRTSPCLVYGGGIKTISRPFEYKGQALMATKSEQLHEFIAGMKSMRTIIPEQMAGFDSMLCHELAPGIIDLKTKELICVAIACYARCEYCIVYHTYSALKAGAQPEELIEAAMTSVIFGGGPSMSRIVTTLKNCIDEFKCKTEAKANAD